MTLLLQFSRRFFRQHPGQLLLALTGMAAGVAVMTGVALVRDVLIDSLDGAAAALAGRDSLRITSPAGAFDEAVYAELAGAPAAPRLVPVVAESVTVGGHRLQVIGTDPFATRGLDEAVGPGELGGLMEAARAAVATPATLEEIGAEPGERIRVSTGQRTVDIEVAGALRAGTGLDGRLVMDIARMQDAFERHGELDWIDAPAAARPWLAERLPAELEIASAEARRRSAAGLTEGMRANLTAMGLISLAVGLFVIHSVLSFLLIQRRRSLAMLRAVGVTGGRITGLLVIEAMLLAGLGALIGLAVGTVLADGLLGLVRSPLAEVYGLASPTAVDPSAALYLGVGAVALAGALVSSVGLLREARDIPPGRILRSGTRSPGVTARATVAAGLLATAAIVLWLSSGLPAAFAALFLTLGGLALVAPVAGLAVLAGLRRVAPSALPGRAVALLLAAPQRIRPALAALSLAMALAAGMAMMVLGFRAAVDDWISTLLRADSYVTASEAALTRDVAGRIARIDGIAGISTARRVDGPDGSDIVAYGLDREAWRGFEWLAGGGPEAFARFDAGEGVAVSEPLARRRGLEPGEAIGLTTPRGERKLPLIGIYRDYASDRGTIAIDADLYRTLYRDPLFDSVGLYYASPSLDAADLRRRLTAIDPALELTTRERVRDETLAVFDRTFRISWALAGLVGLIAVIALVSALLALGLERKRDYATLRALGLTPGRLKVLVVCQTAGLALAAALVALPLAGLIHVGLSLVIQPRAFGWSLPLSWPLEPLAVTLPLALACGLVAGIYPAWRIGRRPPARELRAA